MEKRCGIYLQLTLKTVLRSSLPACSRERETHRRFYFKKKIPNKHALLTVFFIFVIFVNKKTSTTVTYQLANYALETLGEG